MELEVWVSGRKSTGTNIGKFSPTSKLHRITDKHSCKLRGPCEVSVDTLASSVAEKSMCFETSRVCGELAAYMGSRFREIRLSAFWIDEQPQVCFQYFAIVERLLGASISSF